MQRLHESELRARAEWERYGLTKTETDSVDYDGRRTVDRQFGGAGGGEAKRLARPAAELGASQEKLEEIGARRARIWHLVSEQEKSTHGHDDLPRFPAGKHADLLAAGEAIERVYKAANAEHEELRAGIVAAFPVLAAFDADRAGLKAIAGGSDTGRAAAAGGAIDDVLRNIASTRQNLKTEPSRIWKEARVVDGTKRMFGVAPGSIHDAAVNDRVADESSASWVLPLLLGAMTMIPTGGASLAVQALFTAAEITTLALDAAVIAESIGDFAYGTAAAGTDLDTARALAAEEPSLAWLALDIAGLVVGVGGVRRTFKELGHALRASRTAATVDELDAMIAEVREARAAGRISADAEARLVNEMASSAPKESLWEVGRSKIRQEDLDTLERRLGTRPIIEGNGDGVRIEVRDGKTVLVCGENVQVENVLLHARTLARWGVAQATSKTRLQRLWDDLQARMLGDIKENPFPRGEPAWRSFEELRKLDEMIDVKLARLKARLEPGMDMDAIEEEIAFLEGEARHHRAVLEDAFDRGRLGEHGLWVEQKSTGEVTREAAAEGYLLPEGREEWFYYRKSQGGQAKYQLVKKNGAPEEVASQQPHIGPDGKPIPGKFIQADESVRVFFQADESNEAVEQVLFHENSALRRYASMLEEQKLGTVAEVRELIHETRKGKIIESEELRRIVKDHFAPLARKRMEEIAKAATDSESYLKMRALLDNLAPSDKGNLAEQWYRQRFARDAIPHARTRMKGDSKPRFIDLFDDKEGMAIELKNWGGKFGEAEKKQLERYLEKVRQQAKVDNATNPVRKATYVFFRKEGLRANGALMQEALEAGEGRFLVQVFDDGGKATTLTSAADLAAFLK